MLPWSTQYGISLYDWWLLIYRLPVAHCPVFIGGRNRLGPSFSADSRVSVSQSIITQELAPPLCSPCPLPPFPPAPTRASSPSISSFFSVSDNIESLRLAPCDFTSTSTPSTDKFPFPLPPFPHKPEPVSLSRILSNSLYHHPDAPPALPRFHDG